MSTTAVTTALPAAADGGVLGIPRSFGGAVRRLAADTLYLVLGLPMGILTFTWVVTGWSLSLGLLITLIGLPLAVLTIVASRALATVERVRAGLVLGSPDPRALPPPGAARDRRSPEGPAERCADLEGPRLAPPPAAGSGSPGSRSPSRPGA